MEATSQELNKTELPVIQSESAIQTGIDYSLFLDCVHCGLCTSACPTYVTLGNENDSPRGRIYLMRAVEDGRIPLSQNVKDHLELCLDCRACETACPSGVQYGKLIEPFRVAMKQAEVEKSPDASDWFERWILFRLFPYANRLRLALIPARIAQTFGIHQLITRLKLHHLLPSKLKQLIEILPPKEKSQPQLPGRLSAKGKKRATVMLFTGCVGDAMFRKTNWATARVLQENGCDVIIPPTQTCCGAIHFHSGSSEPAKAMADQNIEALLTDQIDAIIVNIAGCGAMLKDYGHHWDDHKKELREKFAAKVKDIHEFLDELGIIKPEGKIEAKATYHDACHLKHAQKIAEAPRNLLNAIPGLSLVPLPETDLCCGAAGTYNIVQPEMSKTLGNRKLDNIQSTKAEIIITANAGCLLQISKYARDRKERAWIGHPIELLDMSYRGESPLR
jgi:glycolate oxidase iron-sulfur subunit